MKPCVRREFLKQSSALTVGGLLPHSLCAAAEPPPEAVKIRFLSDPSIRLAPQYLAMELLRQEGFTQLDEQHYSMALEVMRSVPYTHWRDANPEDTLRFHALRLHEMGMIKTPPNDLIARGTDWRFLNELKKELKA